MVDILATIPEEVLSLIPPHLLAPDPLILMSDNFVTFDLETNMKGQDRSPAPIWKENSIVCGSWCEGVDGGAQNIYGNELEMQPLVDAIEKADFCVAYNGKFDLGWLKRAGIDLYKVLLYDPMIGEYVRLGNRKGETTKDHRGKSRTHLQLDNLMSRDYGESKAAFVNLCMKGGVDPEDIPKSMLIARCDSDITMTRKLFLDQREQLHKMGLIPCVYTRCLLSMPLADIEGNGVCVDPDEVEKEYRDSVTKLAAVAHELDEFTEGRNPKSVPQMKEFIYEVLKFKPMMKGRGKNKEPVYSTKTEDVLQLKATTKRQKKFVELKQEFARHNADVGKTLQFFQGCATDKLYDEPLFYAKFNQCITVTHRLSSSGIKRKFDHMLDEKGKPLMKGAQFQNMPRKYKPLIKARKPGWKVGEADGSQLEFRVAAFLGQCPVATQEIVDNTDIHSVTAKVLTDNGQETQRQGAKQHTFKPLYGGQSGTDAEVAYYTYFREHYVGVGRVQQEWKDEAVVRKQVILPHGFRFYFPNAKLTGTGYVQGSTNICNYPVQHFATAEIIPIAIIYLWHLMRYMESFMTNTVHDSVISEIHPDEVEQFQEYSLYAFTTLVYFFLKEVYNVEFNVPLGIGVKIGDNWGRGTEYKCAPMPPYKMDGIDYSNLLTDWVED